MGRVAEDLSSRTFHLLTALEENGRSSKGEVLWRSVCVCGRERTVSGTALKRGAVKSCGPCTAGSPVAARESLKTKREAAAGARIGACFERLTVARPTAGRVRHFDCECSCGGSKDGVSWPNLISGSIKSCGCIRLEKTLNAALHETADGQWLLGPRLEASMPSPAPSPSFTRIPPMPNAEARPWPTLPVAYERAA